MSFVVCMYLCQSRLGPGAYQVTSYASAARVLRGYMVCTRVAWLHGLHPCACRVVTWFAYSPSPSLSPSPTACGQIRELQRCSVSSNNYGRTGVETHLISSRSYTLLEGLTTSLWALYIQEQKTFFKCLIYRAGAILHLKALQQVCGPCIYRNKKHFLNV